MKSVRIVAACLLCSFGLVTAAENFSSLPDAQRRLLASAESVWPALPPQDRRLLQDNAADWLARSPAQRSA